MNIQRRNKVIIAGGGPVGCATACLLSKRGFKVDLYETRHDIRKAEHVSGRSINLALSVRGIDTLKSIGLAEKVCSLGVPMYSRLIHMPDKTTYAIPYGKKDQFLLSTDRVELNKTLLTAAEEMDDVTIHFGYKVFSDGKDLSNSADAIFGCDGAYSAVRRSLMREKFDYSQRFISHGYMELCIPATNDNEFAMPPNHLHIWPRHEFMLIALPNLDKSFTCTLFMEFKSFEKLKTGDDVIKFFQDIFPDALDLIGKKTLVKDFFTLPPLHLITVKCSPHYSEKALLLGDAAHAVVPFFGQGLNAGLEDTLIFSEILDSVDGDVNRAIPKYSDYHYKDGHAIADLSIRNYLEMRSDVASNWFLFRKKVDGILNKFLPMFFIPKYSMVTFTRIKYADVVKRSKIQDKVVNIGILVTVVLFTAVCLMLITKMSDLDSLTIKSYF